MADIAGPRFIIKHQSGRTYDSEALRSTSRDVDQLTGRILFNAKGFLASTTAFWPPQIMRAVVTSSSPGICTDVASHPIENSLCPT
tara:strand:+ start:731 stop:988 length:258 start_codon:yes stop_codon:yes gene_type:complete